MHPIDRRSFVATGSAAIALTALGIPEVRAAGAKTVSHRHNVFFNFKDDIGADRKTAVLDQIRSLMKEPQVAGYYIGQNLQPMKGDWWSEWWIVVDFENAATAKAFFASEAHARLVAPGAPWPGSYSQLVLIDEDQPMNNIAATNGSGVRNNLIFNFKDDVTPERREKILAELKKLNSRPEVKSYFLGKSNMPIGKGYPFEYQLLAYFASEEKRKAFLASDAHAAFVRDYFADSHSDLAVFTAKA